jgi:hypothetical protein
MGLSYYRGVTMLGNSTFFMNAIGADITPPPETGCAGRGGVQLLEGDIAYGVLGPDRGRQRRRRLLNAAG